MGSTRQALAAATLSAIGIAAAVAATALGSEARPSITVRVNDKQITAPRHTPAGYVDVHIVTTGKVHHHLAFWHLNRGVTAKHFVAVVKRPNGDPFKLATAVGGNAPMLAGRLDTTMRLLPGTIVLADIVEGPTTRIASFRVVGRPVATRPPASIGTIANRNYRFVLPHHFGRPGVYRFTNADTVAHDGVIYRLAAGKTASDLVRWLQRGGKGRPPVKFDRPYGGPGAIGGHWTSWFTLPKLAPGHYVLGCFLTDSHGMLHATMGMVAGFVVR
jgi:hypothetical protein